MQCNRNLTACDWQVHLNAGTVRMQKNKTSKAFKNEFSKVVKINFQGGKNQFPRW